MRNAKTIAAIVVGGSGLVVTGAFLGLAAGVGTYIAWRIIRKAAEQ
jgi:hypothetical protein